jgi:hypothetical protein
VVVETPAADTPDASAPPVEGESVDLRFRPSYGGIQSIYKSDDYVIAFSLTNCAGYLLKGTAVNSTAVNSTAVIITAVSDTKAITQVNSTDTKIMDIRIMGTRIMGTTLTAITDMGDTIAPTDTVVISF